MLARHMHSPIRPGRMSIFLYIDIVNYLQVNYMEEDKISVSFSDGVLNIFYALAIIFGICLYMKFYDCYFSKFFISIKNQIKNTFFVLERYYKNYDPCDKQSMMNQKIEHHQSPLFDKQEKPLLPLRKEAYPKMNYFGKKLLSKHI